jgi:hypothetical protein
MSDDRPISGSMEAKQQVIPTRGMGRRGTVLLSSVLCAAGIIGLAVAIRLYPSAEQRPGVWIEDPDRTGIAFSPKEPHEVRFQVRNETGRTIRVVGLTPC